MKIYLDYAATTPVDKRVSEAMSPFLSEKFGNAGSLHAYGQEASAALDLSREKLAGLINAEFREIVFTGSATEANNLAIRGAVKKARSKHAVTRPEIIVVGTEHESVLETARDLAREGEARVSIVSVNEEGLVDPREVAELLNENTVLVSVAYANNEVGSIQPIKEIGAAIREFKGAGRVYPLFHTDAVQAFQYLPCVPSELNADLMTISSHKIYGPKGVGMLYVKSKSAGIDPVITGGGQEFGLRSGTENILCIVGFASAAGIAVEVRDEEGERVRKLRDDFYRRIKASIPEVELNGPAFGDKRLPNNLNIHFQGRESDELLTSCSINGLAVSSGSACQSRSPSPSHVLVSMYGDKKRAAESLRITLGRGTSKEEVDRAVETIIKIIRNRKINAFN
ncbi:MAG: cysteine desulfurase [Patescibacteria group bacterium]|nr:cysteine desulfurase [Patescibacteria group bacterium]